MAVTHVLVFKLAQKTLINKSASHQDKFVNYDSSFLSPLSSSVIGKQTMAPSWRLDFCLLVHTQSSR